MSLGMTLMLRLVKNCSVSFVGPEYLQFIFVKIELMFRPPAHCPRESETPAYDETFGDFHVLTVCVWVQGLDVWVLGQAKDIDLTEFV